jgi:hypothetical protein
LKLSNIFYSCLILFQVLQFLFGSILLFNIPKNLSDIFLERIILSKHNLGRIPGCNSNFPFNCLVFHEIVDVNLDLVEGYTTEIADNIYYFSWFTTKQVLVKEDINIYRYKEVIELGLVSIENIWCLNNYNMFLYCKYKDSRGLGVLALRRSRD